MPQPSRAFNNQDTSLYNLYNNKHYARAADCEATSADDYIIRGAAKEKLDRMQDAILDYEAAVRIEPTNASAYLQLSKIQLAQQNLSPALYSIKQAIQLQDNNEQYYFYRARIYEQLGKQQRLQYQEQKALIFFDRALADYVRACDLKKDNIISMHGMVRIQILAHNPQKAIKVCNIILKLRPRNFDAISTRAFCHLESKQYKQAITDFKQALSYMNKSNTDPEIYFGLATAHLNQAQNSTNKTHQLAHLDAAKDNYELASTLGTEAQTELEHVQQLTSRLITQQFHSPKNQHSAIDRAPKSPYKLRRISKGEHDGDPKTTKTLC